MRRWTWEDRCILKREYNITPIEELAERLERTVDALHNQVSYLRRCGWTFKEKKK